MSQGEASHRRAIRFDSSWSTAEKSPLLVSRSGRIALLVLLRVIDRCFQPADGEQYHRSCAGHGSVRHYRPHTNTITTSTHTISMMIRSRFNRCGCLGGSSTPWGSIICIMPSLHPQHNRCVGIMRHHFGVPKQRQTTTESTTNGVTGAMMATIRACSRLGGDNDWEGFLCGCKNHVGA